MPFRRLEQQGQALIRGLLSNFDQNHDGEKRNANS